MIDDIINYYRKVIRVNLMIVIYIRGCRAVAADFDVIDDIINHNSKIIRVNLTVTIHIARSNIRLLLIFFFR